MPEYNMQDFILDIPKGLKDKTIHLFTLNESGPSDFAFVASRALAEAGDTLGVFIDRLLHEMRKAFPKLELKERRLTQVDRQPACELSYTWRSDGNLLHQRQTLLLLNSDEAPGACYVTSFIGTCPNAFTTEWAQKYDNIIASIKLRNPASAPVSSSTPPVVRAVSAVLRGPFFMYSAHDGKLNQFPHTQSLYEFCACNAISPESFQFFGPAGQPMVMAAPPPDTEGGWVHPHSGQAFLLWTINSAHVPTLLSLLPSVRHLVGLGNLRDVDCIAAYLHSLKA